MPGPRYYSFRKKKELFSKGKSNYQWETWSSAQANQAQEIAPILNQSYDSLKSMLVLDEKTFNELITQIEKNLSDKNNKSLKISLQGFENDPAVTTIGLKLPFLIHVVNTLVNKGYSIAFNFSEVFFLKGGEPFPAHYSKTDDYHVLSLESYQEIITSFAYQFAKGLFNRFRPEIHPDSSKTDLLVASQYASIKQQDKKELVVDLDTPLANLPCFNSHYEALVHYEFCNLDPVINPGTSQEKRIKDWIILSFDYVQLDDCIKHLSKSNRFSENGISEIIIILHWKKYEEIEQREYLHQAISKTIHDLCCDSFLHIILLTKDAKSLNPADTLLSLAPAYQQNKDPFSPLANNAGYYLSDPKIFAAIGQYIRKNPVKRLTQKWLQQDEICEKMTEVKPKVDEISAYIYGQEPKENIRPSKLYNKQELKSQIGLTFNYNLTLQHEMQQSQSLTQNQDLTKQQSIALQRQHKLDEQVDYPIYTPPIPAWVFLGLIHGAAQLSLEERTLEKELKEEVYYTSWYRANYSEQAILGKIIDPSSEFLVDLVAKVLGQAYTVSPEMRKPVADKFSFADAAKLLRIGHYKMIPLPGYSAESIEAYLVGPIFTRLADFSDGMDPASRHTGYSRFLGNTLMQGWANVSATLMPDDFDFKRLSIHVSSLVLLANRWDRGYQTHFNAYLLSPPKQEVGNPSESYYIASLLTIFSPNPFVLYQIEKPLANTSDYKNSYVFLEESNALYYIDGTGVAINSNLTNYWPLMEGLSRTKPLASGKYLLSRAKIAQWITAMGGITAPDPFTNPSYIAEKEAHFLALMKLTFPDHLAIINKLFATFENHHLDNIRILLQLLLSVERNTFALFLNYLVQLERKCLLSHFYKIYFNYTPTIFSLVNLFKKMGNEVIATHNHHAESLESTQIALVEPIEALFLTLAARTPASQSEEDWPLFERFAHAVLVFAAKNHMRVYPLKELESFWCRVAAKFLAYSDGNPKQQQQLLAHFVANLVTKDGLLLADLRKLDTLLICLENLLDHAIEKHTLWEQIAELQAISLAWTDVPYAIQYNGFHLVSKEMAIKAGSIGDGKNSYAVSLSELTKVIHEFNSDSPPLKTAVFRYLGKESFREDLEFYRNLYPAKGLNPEDNRINELIWAYYVSTFTGVNYNPYPDEVNFSNQCYQFLQQHPYAKATDADKTLLISHFLRRLSQTKTNGQKGSMTLWMLWQENNLSFHLPANTPMPEILAYKFERKQLKQFLLTHQTELKRTLPAILDSVMLKTPSMNASPIGANISEELCTSEPSPALRAPSPHFWGEGENEGSRLPSSALRAPSPHAWGEGKMKEVLRERLMRQEAEKVLAESLLVNFFAKTDQRYDSCLQLLTSLFPDFGLTIFLDHLLEILVFIENFRHLKQVDTPFLAELQILCKKNPDIKVATTLLKLCREKLESQPLHLKPCTLFLRGLAAHPELLPHCASVSRELELLLDYCLDTAVDESSLPVLFGLYKTLRGDAETLKVLLELLSDKKVYAFFHHHLQDELSAPLLQKVAKLIQKTNDPLSVFTFIEYAGPDNDVRIEKLLNLEGEKFSSILFLFNAICIEQTESPLNLLEHLLGAPEDCLHTLARLHKHHPIPLPKLKEVLESPSLPAAIDRLEEQLYQEDIPCYHYDSKEIEQRIKQINYNSWDDELPKYLTPSSQYALLRDYKKSMDYIQNRPVYTEYKDGVACSYTVHQLKSRHFPILFKELQARITRGENKKEYQLVLLAVSSVALKRTCKKFPRSTQHLPLIHSLGEEGQLVQELKTGDGKSIIAALHAVLRVAEGRTGLIPTENEQLGRDGIAHFQDFYRYLGIQCGDRIIEAHSPYRDYVDNKVMYSTPYGLALFFISMAIQKVRIPKNWDLIWDEIDASLTSTVPFRLAATLEPLLLDTKNWSKVYGYLLEFVQERELFLDNLCTDKADLHNFRQYCLLKNPDKDLSGFLKRIPDSMLETFIDSARLAVQLEEKVDYMVVEKEENGKKSLYGAPYLPHTSRAEPRASFGSGAQPLLHAKENKNLSAEAASTFSMLPDTETIISMTPKNLADKVRRQGGRIIGATATPGMPNQLQEFRQQHGITAVHYPSFHPDHCEDLGIVPAEGWIDQKHIALSLIKKSRALRKNQPVLVICETAQAASDLCSDLNLSQEPWRTQSYYGYSKNRHDEVNFIAAAGKENTVSISTKCESRGADFDSDHEHGILVLNLCTHLTEEELKQIKGRAARNGKPGQFCSVIDVQQLNLQKTALAEKIAATFRAFQQEIGLKAQKERAQTRFLEDIRYLATWRLLSLRKKADKILSRQQGQEYSLVETVEFMKTLRDFNKNTEAHYSRLLKEYGQPNEEMKQRFLEVLTQEYNQILERWLPDEKFAHYQPVEPPVPLLNLEIFTGIDRVKIKQLLEISELLAGGWEAIGHQSINTVLTKIEEIMGSLDDYGNTQRGIKTIVGRLLTDSNLLNIPDITSKFDTLEAACLECLSELPAPVETFFSKQKAIDYVKAYFANTKTLFLQGRWEELALPTLPDGIFSGDDNAASSFMTGMIKKGLAGSGSWGIGLLTGKVGRFALVKFYVLPKVMKMMRNQIREWVPDDEVKQLNLMKILHDLEPALADLLLAIFNNIQSKEGIWPLVLNKLLPILEHPSTKEAALLLNKEAGMAFEASVSFIKSLASHKDLSLAELLDRKTLFPILKLASQLGLIQLLVKNPLFKEILNRFSKLDPEFFTAFYHFDFKSLFHFAHLLAHPVFFKFLQELPPEASFSQLKAWVNSELPSPGNVSQALQTLNEYQLNRESLQETSRMKIQGLKAKFILSPAMLQQDLQALEPVFHEAPPIPEPLSSRILTWALAHRLQSLILLVVGILLSWLILPLALTAAAIYGSDVILQKIEAFIEASKAVEEPYVDPIIVNISPPADPVNQPAPELLDLAEVEEDQQENEISPAGIGPLPEMTSVPELGTNLGSSLGQNTNNTNIVGKTKRIGQCYPPNSSRSLGLFVNGNNCSDQAVQALGQNLVISSSSTECAQA